MEVKQVKIGRVSNKAFLLFVVDAINSKYVHGDCSVNQEDSIDVDIVSENKVEAYYNLLYTNDVNNTLRTLQLKAKITFTYEYNCVDIRIYVLSMMVDGEFVQSHIVKQTPSIRAKCDSVLLGIVEWFNNSLLSLAPNISNYENMACSLTNDSIYNGSLFDLLPTLEIGLHISAEQAPQQVQNTSRTYSNNNNNDGENQSLGYTLGKLSVVVQKHWKIILAIVALLLFLLW